MSWLIPFSASPCAHWQSLVPSAYPFPASAMLLLHQHPAAPILGDFCCCLSIPASSSVSLYPHPYPKDWVPTCAGVRLHNYSCSSSEDFLKQRLGCVDWVKWLQNLFCPVFKSIGAALPFFWSHSRTCFEAFIFCADHLFSFSVSPFLPQNLFQQMFPGNTWLKIKPTQTKALSSFNWEFHHWHQKRLCGLQHCVVWEETLDSPSFSESQNNRYNPILSSCKKISELCFDLLCA